MLVCSVIEQPNSQNKTENFGEPVLVESPVVRGLSLTTYL